MNANMDNNDLPRVIASARLSFAEVQRYRARYQDSLNPMRRYDGEELSYHYGKLTEKLRQIGQRCVGVPGYGASDAVIEAFLAEAEAVAA